MASEKTIKKVLDLLTVTPTAQIESLKSEAKGHTKSMRSLIEDKNIVAIGISEKISNRKKTGKLALTFYVEKKMPLDQLRGDQVIPPTVPEGLSGASAVPTDVIAIGKIRPDIIAAGKPVAEDVKANITRHPVQPGNSIGHVDITAGTLGAVVTDGKDLYLLSNSHVFAKSGKAKKGDPIVYPGPFDGGKDPADLVANLFKFIPFKSGGDFVNHVDCALAKPVAARLSELTSAIKGLGIPKGTISPQRGMKIAKCGRTTGKTTGEIKDIHFRFVLSYEEEGAGEVGYIDQVLCTRYTEGGDSGSLVLDQASGKAVGLHFAGANGGSVFNPIEGVLTALSVKLVTGTSATANAIPSKKKKNAVKKRAKVTN